MIVTTISYCVTPTLLSVCGGGNGVYAFFSFFFFGCFLLLIFLLTNFGKNLYQFSFFKLGYFANSFLIINALIL